MRRCFYSPRSGSGRRVEKIGYHTGSSWCCGRTGRCRGILRRRWGLPWCWSRSTGRSDPTVRRSSRCCHALDIFAGGEEACQPGAVHNGIAAHLDVGENGVLRPPAGQIHPHIDHRHLPCVQVAVADDVVPGSAGHAHPAPRSSGSRSRSRSGWPRLGCSRTHCFPPDRSCPAAAHPLPGCW